MNIKLYNCFIASPGDTKNEREICDKVINELNRTIGKSFNFRIESKKWEKDTRPSVGEYSQKLINEQIGTDYDIFIGIMYKKFGTATKTAGSGTEEEFKIAYEIYKKGDDVEIMFYFNDEPTRPSEINTEQYEKVKQFKRKVADLGVYYWNYNGTPDFEENLKNHLYQFFNQKYSKKKDSVYQTEVKDSIRKILSNRLDDALTTFEDQPIIWVEPIISSTNEISKDPNKNYEQRIQIGKVIENCQSTIIKAPPQFGLTCLSHYLVLQAWEKDKLWVYVNSDETKEKNIHKKVLQNIRALGLEEDNLDCIVLDNWNAFEGKSLKKLRNLSLEYPDTPIFVMERIDDSKFSAKSDNTKIDRNFNTLHLLALPRTEIRKVVSEYNRRKSIGEEEIILSKVVSDLECLNIHRTPMNCFTLLKVSEKYFDESPVNRTKMLEMVLFVLFNLDGIPKYKTKPDLKDTEYVLGRFCEVMIQNNRYTFSRTEFINDLKKFCSDKKLDIEIEIVFDVLVNNNILCDRYGEFSFRSSFWIYFFAAKRMHSSKEFSNYIFDSGKYAIFPEIIEFYTGIDRNRSDALEKLVSDLKITCDEVNSKVGIPDNINPLIHATWHPDEAEIEKMEEDITTNLTASKLPDYVKDQVADKDYDQIRPYDQSINHIFHQYSLYKLMQQIKATSRALRNSDYVEPELKQRTLSEIQRSWEQVSKVLFLLTPMLAIKGKAVFGGIGFVLGDNFSSNFKDRLNAILQVNPTNVVGFFKDDIYSSKMGPLLFEELDIETSALKKHFLALLIVFERPRNWKKEIEKYIVSLPKNSFFLFDIVNNLKAKYKFGFLNDSDARSSEYLIKMGLAKNHFGSKKPGLHQIKKVSNKNLPNRIK